MIHPKKYLSQNFLINQGIVEKIISAAELSKNDTVLEVGPGRGVLTEELIKYAGRIVAVEKDKHLFELLKEKFSAAKNLELVNEDIFTYRLQATSYKLIANIPYNITGQFFHNFLLSDHRPSMIVVMVQKEVGERLLGKNKSILSVTAELYGTTEKVCDVSPGSFSPPPKIMSSVIKLIRNPFFAKATKDKEEKILHLAKIGFASRRKKLVSNLSTGLKISKDKIKEVFNQVGLNENARAEELSLSDWLKLAKDIEY